MHSWLDPDDSPPSQCKCVQTCAAVHPRSFRLLHSKPISFGEFGVPIDIQRGRGSAERFGDEGIRCHTEDASGTLTLTSVVASFAENVPNSIESFSMTSWLGEKLI